MDPRIIRATAIGLMAIVVAGVGYQIYLSTQNPIEYLAERGQAPDFTLPNIDGENFTMSDSDGKIRILTFIYTKCDEGCAVITSKMADIREELQENDLYNEVQMITIDFDYMTDTMENLQSYSSTFREDSNDHWQFLLGNKNQTDTVADAYNFTFYMDMSESNETTSSTLHPSETDHSGHSVVYIHPFLTWFIDQKGEIRSIENGLDWTAERGYNIVDFLVEENNES